MSFSCASGIIVTTLQIKDGGSERLGDLATGTQPGRDVGAEAPSGVWQPSLQALQTAAPGCDADSAIDQL